MDENQRKLASAIRCTFVALVLVVYVGTYFWLVRRDTSGLELNGNPVYPYRSLHFVFAPVHWIDRCLRPGYWVESDSLIPM
jgi:hypothetical protein